MKTSKISAVLLAAITLATASHTQASASPVAANKVSETLSSPSSTEIHAKENLEEAEALELLKISLRQDFYQRMTDIGQSSLK